MTQLFWTRLVKLCCSSQVSLWSWTVHATCFTRQTLGSGQILGPALCLHSLTWQVGLTWQRLITSEVCVHYPDRHSAAYLIRSYQMWYMWLLCRDSHYLGHLRSCVALTGKEDSRPDTKPHAMPEGGSPLRERIPSVFPSLRSCIQGLKQGSR